MTEPQGERLFPREDGPARLLDWKSVQEALFQAGRANDDFLVLVEILTNGPSSERTQTALQSLNSLRIEDWDLGVPDDVRQKVESAREALEAYLAQSIGVDAEEVNRILALYPRAFRTDAPDVSPLKNVEINHDYSASTLLVGHLYDGEIIPIGHSSSLFVDINRLSSQDRAGIEEYIQAHELGL